MDDRLLVKIDKIKDQIKVLYLHDDRPLVVGFSGGKDSTLTLQLSIESLYELWAENPLQIKKATYIISSDTLIENPFVSTIIASTFSGLKDFQEKLRLSLLHVKPKLEDSFWVSTIGKGYPLPLNRFRWCTRQLKISPIENEMNEILMDNPNIISVLGIRKNESQTRAIKMSATLIKDNIFENKEILNSIIFAPINDLSIDELWNYLLSKKESMWKTDFGDLYEMYWDSSKECPMSLELAMVEDSTSGCGKSRWGCWMCSMSDRIWLDNMVENGLTIFKPLSDFRSGMILERDERKYRYIGKHLIMSNNGNKKVLLSPRGLTKLKRNKKNDVGCYYQPKKGVREKQIYMKVDDYQFTSPKGGNLPIIDKSVFMELFKENGSHFFREAGSEIEYIVRFEDEYYIPSTGPYTLQYRYRKLMQLLNMQIKMKKQNLELFNIQSFDIISLEEIRMIFNLWNLIANETNKKVLVRKYIDSVKMLLGTNKNVFKEE